MPRSKPSDTPEASLHIGPGRPLAPLELVDANNLRHCQVIDEGDVAKPQQVGQGISHELLLE